MVPETPAEWLTYLSDQLAKRTPGLFLLQRYVTGDAPLPTGATKHREAYSAFQKKARTDFASLVVDAVAERMTVSGFRVGDSPVDNDAARSLWRRSLMDAASSDIHRDMLTFGVGYGMASPTSRGALLTRESPLGCITDHDPMDPTTARAALKVWEDHDMAYAVLHLPGEVHYYQRQDSTLGMSLATGQWDYLGVNASGLDVVPVVRFANREMTGEFANHTDLLDRINWVILQRLLIIAMQAFRQRAVAGDLPDTDEEGNPIDWNTLFAPGPDALWVLPEGVSIWESTPSDIQQILSAVKDDIRDLSAVTRTPMSVLSPDAANQSAEGAALMREGLVFKAEDRCHRAGPAWSALVGLGMRLDGAEASDVEVLWAPAERQSLAERADAVTKLAASLPWRRLMTDVMGYDAAAVDQMDTERAADVLNLLMATGVNDTAGQAITATDGQP